MSIVIMGLSDADKVPGSYEENLWGTGGSASGKIPLKCLLVGNKLSTGSAVADQDIDGPFTSGGDADAKYGVGSELALMIRAALSDPNNADAAIYAGAIAESAGTKAAGTITIAGTWSTGGSFSYRIAGVPVTGAIGASDDATAVAAAIAAAVNALASKLPVTATSLNGVVTLTATQKGPRGNQILVAQDKRGLPTGATSTLAGGTALTGGITPLASGATADDPTTLLAIIANTQWDRIGIAQNDATNLAKWKAALDAQAGATVNIVQQAIVATNGALSAAASIAQTTLNDPVFEVLWDLNGETLPSCTAAIFAATRAVAESADPGASYDGHALVTVAPHSQPADIPSHATLVAALNEGVTPLTTVGGVKQVVRAICSRSLVGAVPNYDVLDVADVSTPQYVRFAARKLWYVLKADNPRSGPDPSSTQRAAPSGVLTPKVWVAALVQLLRDLESNAGNQFPGPLVQDVDNHMPIAEWNSAARRITCAVPVVPMTGNHQIGISVRQTAA